MYRTKNHRNILLTRILPSNTEKEHVFVILHDFLACGWVNFVEQGKEKYHSHVKHDKKPSI